MLGISTDNWRAHPNGAMSAIGQADGRSEIRQATGFTETQT
jgi:hypothetical protein